MSGTYYVLIAPKKSFLRRTESFLRRMVTEHYSYQETKLGGTEYVMETFVGAESLLEAEVQHTTHFLNRGILQSLWKAVEEKPNSSAHLKLNMPTAF